MSLRLCLFNRGPPFLPSLKKRIKKKSPPKKLKISCVSINYRIVLFFPSFFAVRPKLPSVSMAHSKNEFFSSFDNPAVVAPLYTRRPIDLKQKSTSATKLGRHHLLLSVGDCVRETTIDTFPHLLFFCLPVSGHPPPSLIPTSPARPPYCPPRSLVRSACYQPASVPPSLHTRRLRMTTSSCLLAD